MIDFAEGWLVESIDSHMQASSFPVLILSCFDQQAADSGASMRFLDPESLEMHPLPSRLQISDEVADDPLLR